MSYKHVGPIGWEFSGDKARCFQLIGPARLLAQQALDKIQARGGRGQQMERRRLADGSTIRVQVVWNFEAPLIRAYIQAPGGKQTGEIKRCFESGLLFSALVPPRVYAGTWLYSLFSKSPSWQGSYTEKQQCLRWDAWTSGDSYLSCVYKDGFAMPKSDIRDLSVQGFVRPASFTGLLRLVVQAKYGAGVSPLTLLLRNGNYGATLDGRYHGIVRNENTYWFCYVHPSVGLRAYELSYADACPSGDSELREAFVLSSLVPKTYVVDGVSFYNEVQVLESSAISSLIGQPCGHGWHWSRTNSEAAIALVENFTPSERPDGLDCSQGRVYRLRLLFTEKVGVFSMVPTGTVAAIATGAKVRFFHGRVPIWFPLHELNQYVCIITRPPYTWSQFYAPFEGNTTPIYAFYSDSGELSVLLYHQYYIGGDTSGDYDPDCWSPTATEASGGVAIFNGGFSISGVDGFNSSVTYPVGLVDSRSINRFATGEFTRTGSALPSGLSSGWATGGGGVYSPELEAFASDLGPGNIYGSVEQTIQYGTVIQTQRLYVDRNQTVRRCAIIPFTDAECVLLFSQNEAQASRLTTTILTMTSGPDGSIQFAAEGEFIKYLKDGSVGDSTTINATYYNGLGDCPYVSFFGGANYGFVPGWFSGYSEEYSEFEQTIENNWSDVSCNLSIVSSTGVVSRAAGLDDMGPFLYPSEENALIDVIVDAHFGYHSGGGFSDTAWSYDGHGGYPPSLPSFSSFIGGA